MGAPVRVEPQKALSPVRHQENLVEVLGSDLRHQGQLSFPKDVATM